MKNHRLFSILLGLSVIGLVLSISLSLLYYEIRSGQSTFNPICKINETFDCSAVDGSKYAEIIPGFPLASFTAGWFLAAILISTMGFASGWAAVSLRTLTGMSAFGTVLGVFYFLIMAFVLKKYCPQCIGIDLVNIITLVVSFLGLKKIKGGNNPTNDQWKKVMGTIAGSVIFLVLFMKSFDQSKLEGVTHKELADSIRQTQAASINVNPSLPVLGNPNAAITIVEFSDFQCPHCRQGALVMHAVLERYPNQVKVVYAGFPLDNTCNTTMKSRGHPHACEAARVAMCANEQGKFKKMYETIFDRQDEITDGSIMAWAKEIGLDMPKLEKCVTDSKTIALLSSSIDQALALGVKSTPTFFLNGKKVEGAMPLPVWALVLDEMTATHPTK